MLDFKIQTKVNWNWISQFTKMDLKKGWFSVKHGLLQSICKMFCSTRHSETWIESCTLTM